MTEKTVTPENGASKHKIGEILRFLHFMDELHLKPDDIQRDTGVALRTIQNSIYENNPLGAKLLRACHLKYGVSLNWLVSGVGPMLVNQQEVRDAPGNYSVDADRLGRIMKNVDDWMMHATEQEKTWLEIDIKQRLILNWPPLGVHKNDS